MERNTERKTLSFSKGMTNVPSDLLSEDSELVESEGFIYRDGEMKPIQKPVNIGNIPYKIMYVHKMADYENVIAYNKDDGKIYSYKKDGKNIDTSNVKSFEVGNVTDIKSIGNTLVCATDKGLCYLLYKSNEYKYLGYNIPEPSLRVSFGALTNEPLDKSIQCYLPDDTVTHLVTKYVHYDENTGEFVGFANLGQSADFEYFQYTVDEAKRGDFNDAVDGHISAVISKIKQERRFAFPFMMRCAIKLYDGSYTKITAPIVCFPCVNENFYFAPVRQYSDHDYGEELNERTEHFMYKPYHCKMMVYVSIKGLKDWKDIVDKIVVFKTRDTTPFALGTDKWDFMQADASNGKGHYNNNLRSTATTFYWTISNFARCVIYPLSTKTEKEIIDEMNEKVQFYKLFEVDADSEDLGKWIDAPIKKGVLENLETEEQLNVDDYYSWAITTYEKLYPYNGRFNAFQETRYPFKGFDYFTSDFSGLIIGNNLYESYDYDIFVHIVSSYMDCWVKSDVRNMLSSWEDTWFFYPDPNATEVVVRKNTSSFSRSLMRIKLKKHPLLNGAYSFNHLPIPGRQSWNDNYKDDPIVDSSACERFDSNIYTSAVNNPFTFEASGDNTVGTGKILGIMANTEAISQGQFGQYPLIVFTDEGMYGMGVTSEGLYGNIYPISRDVCNNAESITPTDRLVFFTSNKGLMAVSGGTSINMSEQLRGRMPLNFTVLGNGKFIDFAKDCLIAYDYRDSMLRIFGKEKNYQYVYNMIDKTFSMVNSGIVAQTIVNDYPDSLIQDSDGNVYSLIEKPDINDDENLYNGTITTRPLKLGGSMTLKSLRNIKNLRSTLSGKLQLEIWGSNNAENWCKLYSLKGKPWSYFTFKYTLTNFKACDSFAGTIVDIQNRRELK